MKKGMESRILQTVAAAGKKSIKLGNGLNSWLGVYQPKTPQGIEKFCQENQKTTR